MAAPDRRALGQRARRGAAALLLAAVPTTAGQGLAIVGATVFDGSGRPALRDGVVVIQGERIEGVGPRSHVPLPKGIPYLDGSRLFVLPGRFREPATVAALRRRLAEGVGFEKAVADVLHAEGPPEAAGTVARGRFADLLVLDKDPRVDLENLGSVKQVFVRGRATP